MTVKNARCFLAECRMLVIVMLSVVKLSVLASKCLTFDNKTVRNVQCWQDSTIKQIKIMFAW